MNTNLRWMRRRVLALAVAALCVAAISGTAVAGHQTSGVKSYTGCHVGGDGVIIKVKEGNSPRSACSGGQVEAHFSGGDISKISVGSGLSLPNGGDNGEVRIVLDASHSLPQGCSDGQVAKWETSLDPDRWVCRADNDTTYTADGTTLDLSGGQFSIDPDYRVLNAPDCPSGQFANGFAGDGEIRCAAPPAATLQAFSGPQTNFNTGAGIPDDGAFHVMASVTVPAGNYLITAKGQITSAGNVDGFSATECQIQSGAVIYDSMRWGSVTIDDNPSTTLSLAGLGATGGASIDLACAADEGADGVGLRYGRLVVVKVG